MRRIKENIWIKARVGKDMKARVSRASACKLAYQAPHESCGYLKRNGMSINQIKEGPHWRDRIVNVGLQCFFKLLPFECDSILIS